MRKIADFKAHIELHRARVVRLGVTLSKCKFPHLSSSAVESFLSLHDHSKTLNSPQELRSLGYFHHRPPLERLFDFYGKTRKSEAQSSELDILIKDINSIDDEVARSHLEHLRLDTETMQSFYKIEKVADLVDRSLDPLAREEFGHPMILASEYLQDPYLSSLSVWLEHHYRHITHDLSFLSHRKAE